MIAKQYEQLMWRFQGAEYGTFRRWLESYWEGLPGSDCIEDTLRYTRLVYSLGTTKHTPKKLPRCSGSGCPMYINNQCSLLIQLT